MRRSSNSLHNPRVEGIIPVNGLSDIVKCCSFVSCPISWLILPVKSFPSRYSMRRVESLNRLDGKVPLRPPFPRSDKRSNIFISPRLLRISPLRLFIERSKVVKNGSSPSSGGIVPCKKFPLNWIPARNVKRDISGGMIPVREKLSSLSCMAVRYFVAE